MRVVLIVVEVRKRCLAADRRAEPKLQSWHISCLGRKTFADIAYQIWKPDRFSMAVGVRARRLEVPTDTVELEPGTQFEYGNTVVVWLNKTFC